ncbi:hypothetical protein ACFL13_02710 [Patescibacteria group bacterium]
MRKIIIKHIDRIVSSIATISLLFNLSQPIIIVYAAEAMEDQNSSEVVEEVVEEEIVEEEAAEEEVAGEAAVVEEEEATNEEIVEEETIEEVIVEEEVVEEEIVVVEEVLEPTSTEEEVIEEETTKEETTEEETTEETVIEGDILDEGASDFRPESKPEDFVEAENAVAGIECVGSDRTAMPNSEDDWEIDGDLAETKDDVELGVKYEFPLDEDVSVTFTCLPKDKEARSHLKIERVKVEDLDLPGDFLTDAEYAYDITTDMENGDFEYDLTLPKVEDVDAGIAYIEMSAEKAINEGVGEEDIEEVEEDKVDQDEDVVKVGDLNHLSIWIATYSDATFSTTKTIYAQAETVFVKAGQLNTSKYYKIAIDPPSGGGSTLYITSCFNPSPGNRTLEGTHVLPFDAKISKFWKAELKEYDWSNCKDFSKEKDNSKFEVIAGSGPSIAAVETNNTGVCIEDAAGGDLNCTAGDVSIADVTSIDILDDGCQFVGDTVTFRATWEVQSTATQRYDIGLYFATEGQTNARTGECSVSTLPNDPVPPWYNYDFDACGDISSSASVYPEIELTVVCLDTDGNNLLDLPYCTSWDNQAGGVCSGPDDAIPSNKAKCYCPEGGYTVPITVPYSAEIEVIKELVPSGDSGQFNLQIDGTDEVSCVGNAGTTGAVVVGAGTSDDPGDTHTVGETACSGTDLGDYNISISCVDRATGAFVAGDSGAGPIDIDVEKDDDVLCTITNSLQEAYITVEKIVVNDDGGALTAVDFPLYIDTTQVTSSAINTVLPGTYTVSEISQSGYTPSVWEGDCDDNGSVTVAAGESKTCEITNDDQPATLIVKKIVTNDNGGNLNEDDFTFSVNGDPAVAFEADGQNDLTVNAGTYTVTEPAVTGYATTYDNCTGVVIPNGGTATCTITNNDVAPTITLIKDVITDDNGNAGVNDFNLTVGGAGVLSGDTTEVLANAAIAINETVLPGYNFVSITGDAKCPDVLGGTVTLSPGENITCTIHNNDVAPKLTLVKDVITDDGGSAGPNDFGISVGGTVVTSGVANDYLANTPYAIDEAGLFGYNFVSITGDRKCPANLGDTITLDEGDDITCTITNDDIAPTLTLVKVVTKDDGGNETQDDFQAYIDLGPVAWDTATPLRVGGHDASESTLPGYTSGDWGGDCAADGSVTLGAGENKTCTITNDDVAPKLTLVKDVINDNGGNAQPNDFFLTIGGNPATSGVDYDLMANTPYAINETVLTGYNFVEITGDPKCPSSLGGNITLDEGDDITCTITNDDVAPSITLIKSVTNDDGGSAGPNDFGISVGGSYVSSGVSNNYPANTPLAISEDGLSGYSFVDITGDAKCPAVLGGTISLDEGESVTCTITNDDNPPSLKLVKEVTNDNGGQATSDQWTLYAKALCQMGDTDPACGFFDSGDSTTFHELDANRSYNLWEVGPSGYTQGSFSCDGGTQNGNKITLSLEDQVTCTITNDDNEPSLTLVKEVFNDDGGKALPSDWTLTATGPTGFSGSGPSVSNGASFDIGTYDLSESSLSGYTASDWVCVGGSQVDGDTITLGLGESATCTITNDDNPPSLKLVKEVTNDNGGQATSDQWTLYAKALCQMGDTDPACGFFDSGDSTTFHELDANRSYNLWEVGPSGYTQGSFSCDGGTQNGNKITLSLEDQVTCTITNDDNAPRITLIKNVINDNGGLALPTDWTLYATGSVGSFSGTSPATSLVFANTSYTLTEGNGPAGYTEGTWECTSGEEQINGDNHVLRLATTIIRGSPITLSLGEDVTCTITNDDIQPKLTVKKVVVGDETSPSAFTIHVKDSGGIDVPGSPAAGSGSGVVYSLNAGTYQVSEVQPSNFIISYSGDCDESGNVTLVVGEPDKECIVTNTKIGELTISKENDATGDLKVGDKVKYTITVTAKNGKVLGVNVIDLLPEGFEFDWGSWSGPNMPTGYTSPGTWALGDMEDGDVITLSYEAVISSGVDEGLYKDLAWTKGEDVIGGDVLGDAINPGFVDDNFVGTEVNVITEEDISDEAEVEVNEIVEEEGEVLGASTYLPATGSNTVWLRLAQVLFALGSLSVILGILTMKKKINLTKFGFKIIVFVLASTLLSASVYAASLVVRIEEPEPNANSSFEITFVALDLEGRDLIASCFKKGPGEASFSKFGSDINLSSGGDSANCSVGSSVLSGDGTYTFKVEVKTSDNSTTATSNEVTVNYDGEGPERPKYIKKDKKSSCKYEIEVKTHQDGDTSYIEVYADDDKEIEVNAGSRVRTIVVGPDQKVEFDIEFSGSDCGKTWYFATRAFDAAGNPSSVRAEEIDDVTTKVVYTTEEETEVTGAIPVSFGGGEILGDQEAGEGEEEGGEVLGEEEIEEIEVVLDKGTVGLLRKLFGSKFFWIVLALLVLIILNEIRKKREK